MKIINMAGSPTTWQIGFFKSPSCERKPDRNNVKEVLFQLTVQGI